jgi:tetratricopeptide (TPR) repeat protein
VEIARRVESLAVRAEATQTLAVCLLGLGRTAESNALLEDAFVLAKQAGQRTNLMRAYNNVAAARVSARGPAAAETVLREGLDLALRSGIRANAGWIAGTLADMLVELGRLEEAEDYQRRAIELARSIGDVPLTGMRLISLAIVVLTRGRIDDAIALRDEAAPIMAANPERQSDPYLPEFDAYLALGRGDLRQAAAQLVAAIDLLRDFAIEAIPEMFPSAARVYLLLGDRDRAGSFRDLDGAEGSVASNALARNVTGLLERDPAESIRVLREAIAALESLDMPILAARAMGDLARALRRTGADASAVVERARDMLVQCDAHLFKAELEAPLPESV